MDKTAILNRLHQLTRELKPVSGGAAELRSFEREIASQLIKNPDLAILGNRPTHEGATGEAIDLVARFNHLDDLFTSKLTTAEEISPLVFRRDTSFRNTLLGNSVPAWGAGLGIARSFGPFIDEHGLPVWFDFFLPTRMVQLFIKGNSSPALLFSVWGSLTSRTNYRIEAGSVWIASDLIARTSALKGYYTGLRVKSGTLDVSQIPDVTTDRIIITPNSVATLHLELDQVSVADTASEAGLDASASSVHLPDTFDLRFNALGSRAAAANASCTVFGCDVEFQYATATPVWISVINQILVPYEVRTNLADSDLFAINSSNSSLCTLSNSARTSSDSGWLLPAAKIAPKYLGVAAGTGALCVTLRNGLEANWKGLTGGETKLIHPSIIAEPGLLTVLDLFAQNIHGKQKWILWKNTANKHHSEIALTFGKSFPFVFTSSVGNTEGVFYFCGHKAAFDRPVDANGSPFRIQSKAALAGILQTGAAFRAILFDDDLTDGDPASVFERCSIILRNALFNCGLPSTLLLTGELEDDNRIVDGVVALTHQNILYLPTLPDPYVASYTPYLRDRAAFGLGQLPVVLSAFVKWPDAPPGAEEGEEPVESYIYFRFSPIDQTSFQPKPVEFNNNNLDSEQGTRNFHKGLASFNRSLATAVASRTELSSLVSSQSAVQTGNVPARVDADLSSRAARGIERGNVNQVVKELGANPLLMHITDKNQQVDETIRAALINNEGRYGNLPPGAADRDDTRFDRSNRGLFAPDAFMLLDVSSNVDQMGVSLGNALRVERRENGDTNLRHEGGFFGVAAPQDRGLQLQILNMDVVATAQYLRAVTLPQVSWEPIFNIPLEIQGSPPANDLITTTPGILVYDNDGIPTRIFSESSDPVPITPQSVTNHFLKKFDDSETPKRLLSVFTLPFALEAYAQFERKLKAPPDTNVRLQFNRPSFDELLGGLQIKALAPKSNFSSQSPSFKGAIIQLEDYIRWFLFGAPISGTTLGRTVKTIFDTVFTAQPKVPLEKIEFSGYGASIFSNWLDTDAAVADVSQVKFDVLVGRAAHEVIQVRSILYPWGVHVVRTITLMRSGNGYVYRSDSGWKAESDGFCDFSYFIDFGSERRHITSPYTFHPGVVSGVSNVREIKDYPDAGPYKSSFSLRESGLPDLLGKKNLSDWLPIFNKLTSLDEQLPVILQAVVFDADVHIQNVKSGGIEDPSRGDFRVQSRKMLGYVQLSPPKILLSRKVFTNLLNFQNGSLGGAVDCLVDIAKSKQTMRLARVDVNPALDGSGQEIFVNAARGSLILPQDGSWSVVKQQTETGHVNPLEQGQTIPLIKRNSSTSYRIANPADVIQEKASKTSFGVLQSTGTQKLLFDGPFFSPNQPRLKSAETYFADAYKLLNSKSVFPNIGNALELTNAEKEVEIQGEGLMKMAERQLNLGSLLPSTYTYPFVNEPGILKIYAEYKTKSGSQGQLTLGINSKGALADKWKAALANMRIVVDLGIFTEVMWVDGNFNASSGVKTKYDVPHLQFGPLLDPVIHILEVLSMLSGDDFDRGMDVGMSNSPDNWEYKFNCSKEIPVIKFPSPQQLTLNPNPPLKLEAGLKVGFYFNQMLSIPTDIKQLAPSCGAYIDFFGRLEVQCFTLAIASVYGVGQVNLGITADTKSKVSVHMKFGFGAEIVVGLPVVLNVAVLYVAEVTVSLGDTGLDVGAMLLFRGSAEICGGLIAIAIQIEAGGSVHHTFSPKSTNVVAQVTFSVDVTVAWVIDIEHTETWQESRQIA